MRSGVSELVQSTRSSVLGSAFRRVHTANSSGESPNFATASRSRTWTPPSTFAMVRWTWAAAGRSRRPRQIACQVSMGGRPSSRAWASSSTSSRNDQLASSGSEKRWSTLRNVCSASPRSSCSRVIAPFSTSTSPWRRFAKATSCSVASSVGMSIMPRPTRTPPKYAIGSEVRTTAIFPRRIVSTSRRPS